MPERIRVVLRLLQALAWSSKPQIHIRGSKNLLPHQFHQTQWHLSEIYSRLERKSKRFAAFSTLHNAVQQSLNESRRALLPMVPLKLPLGLCF
jgi:hypothetical protein